MVQGKIIYTERTIHIGKQASISSGKNLKKSAEFPKQSEI
jgi:hypothetical protein